MASDTENDSDNDYESLHNVEDVTDNAHGPVTRDLQFYRVDGDTVIQVGCKLFKVHRFLLKQDESVFASMFSLPVGRSSIAEGSSDDRPVVIDETPGQFRNLLWVLYALPPQIHALGSTVMHLWKLLDIAEMANKYQFTTTAAWSADLVYRKLNRSWPKFFMAATADDFNRLLDVAYLCGHEPLVDLVVEKWSLRLKSGDLAPALAIIASEKYQIRPLLGLAYFLQLVQASSSPKFTAPALLTKKQVERLLYGQFSLLQLWDSLREDMPSIESVSCYSHHNCVLSWQDVYSNAWVASHATKASSTDILAKIGALHQNLLTKQPSTIRNTCWQGVMKQLGEMSKQVQATLADHFVDED